MAYPLHCFRLPDEGLPRKAREADDTSRDANYVVGLAAGWWQPLSPAVHGAAGRSDGRSSGKWSPKLHAVMAILIAPRLRLMFKAMGKRDRAGTGDGGLAHPGREVVGRSIYFTHVEMHAQNLSLVGPLWGKPCNTS